MDKNDAKKKGGGQNDLCSSWIPVPNARERRAAFERGLHSGDRPLSRTDGILPETGIQRDNVALQVMLEPYRNIPSNFRFNPSTTIGLIARKRYVRDASFRVQRS
jgi:hypothetical protein